MHCTYFSLQSLHDCLLSWWPIALVLALYHVILTSIDYFDWPIDGDWPVYRLTLLTGVKGVNTTLSSYSGILYYIRPCLFGIISQIVVRFNPRMFTHTKQEQSHTPLLELFTCHSTKHTTILTLQLNNSSGHCQLTKVSYIHANYHV
jgi:hypothetical protein